MRIFGLVGLLVVLGCGFYIYQRSATSTLGDTSPQEQIDTVTIRQRLLTIGQTEKQYMATHGKYATLAQLSHDNLLPGGIEQRGYTFSAEVNGATGFTITATPTDDDKEDWPTLEITESMKVTER
ncbi:MAG: type IV pilin protein [Acidobacteriota bacterium]|nr:type IV pilin protein [Acidobacteriota bacterium]